MVARLYVGFWTMWAQLPNSDRPSSAQIPQSWRESWVARSNCRRRLIGYTTAQPSRLVSASPGYLEQGVDEDFE